MQIADEKIKLKRMVEWEQTSSILAMIHNAMSKTKKAPKAFNPMLENATASITAREFVDIVRKENK